MQNRALLHPFMQEEIREETEIDRLFTEIFGAYYKRIFNYIGYRVSSIHTVEDLTSVVFEKILMVGTEENRELLELGQALSGKDFSKYSNRSAVLQANTMKNKRGFKRPAIALSAVLAAGVLSIAIAQPSFAQDIVDKVLASFNLGHIEVAQTEPQAQPTESTGK